MWRRDIVYIYVYPHRDRIRYFFIDILRKSYRSPHTSMYLHYLLPHKCDKVPTLFYCFFFISTLETFIIIIHILFSAMLKRWSNLTLGVQLIRRNIALSKSLQNLLINIVVILYTFLPRFPSFRSGHAYFRLSERLIVNNKLSIDRRWLSRKKNLLYNLGTYNVLAATTRLHAWSGCNSAYLVECFDATKRCNQPDVPDAIEFVVTRAPPTR